MTDKNAPRTFPLRVNQKWLDRIDKYKKPFQPKHDFILEAVEEKIKRHKKGYEIMEEEK